MKTLKLTPMQIEWLKIVAEPNGARVRDWAGSPYSVLGALERKGLIARPSKQRERGGFGRWDSWGVTETGRQWLAAHVEVAS